MQDEPNAESDDRTILRHKDSNMSEPERSRLIRLILLLDELDRQGQKFRGTQ